MLLNESELSTYSLSLSNIHQRDENTFIVIKDIWNYESALRFQEEMVQRVYKNKSLRVFIFCNHPHCLTLGRGLQRRTKADEVLVDFDESLRKEMTIPLYDVKRGGGITFHYPGQLVFYPILSLERHKKKVMDFLNEVLREVKAALESLYQIDKLECEKDLLGLWREESKLASIGLCSHKFITYHGLALNLYEDDLMRKVLGTIYPCGLRGETYMGLSQVMKVESDLFYEITQYLISKSSLLGRLEISLD
ncbi:lipoyltransferase [Halobacteriovorax marinus SJ]|uniref:Octanoyltransferase n=1 Tax=Halobacteriovorax marinus (strain ATCC BAA-682 / DSM 15412 / SJ) TaxID=862908 RepID=E1X649_HALMS|nr:lipoyltransferase [Halobacteriovorax marinus]CBW27393.1 lipoyltransferase [Halobacteriovorax marinus SJ]